ncbi:unnamed protein product [Spirodela intermedia]|uniref:Reverse transcriptase Ty1/copia-type domain-containing protein n=1 Tax=Spirodela intermedia TaxID=51605 RepID=A0A7I8J2K5_SPIIN|nr:unnamed protein product [Spirodela intermedia]CAA6663550.1 unnamed protein product [Spirodela intermedia]
MDEDIDALEKNWKKVVGCKWVSAPKYKANGTLERYKARLVAKGYLQSDAIEYFERFAPVAKLNTIPILIALTVNLGWEMHQLDVKNVFLHENLEEVYMNEMILRRLNALAKIYLEEFDIKSLGRLKYFLGIEVTYSKEGIHLQATYQVLAYLKTITRQDILFKKGGKQSIEIYTDVDYARSVIDRRSTSGYCTFDCRNLVTWGSKKQQVVA